LGKSNQHAEVQRGSVLPRTHRRTSNRKVSEDWSITRLLPRAPCGIGGRPDCRLLSCKNQDHGCWACKPLYWHRTLVGSKYTWAPTGGIQHGQSIRNTPSTATIALTQDSSRIQCAPESIELPPWVTTAGLQNINGETGTFKAHRAGGRGVALTGSSRLPAVGQ